MTRETPKSVFELVEQRRVLLRALAAGHDAPFRDAAIEILPELFLELGLRALQREHAHVGLEPAHDPIVGRAGNSARQRFRAKRGHPLLERLRGTLRQQFGTAGRVRRTTRTLPCSRRRRFNLESDFEIMPDPIGCDLVRNLARCATMVGSGCASDVACALFSFTGRVLDLFDGFGARLPVSAGCDLLARHHRGSRNRDRRFARRWRPLLAAPESSAGGSVFHLDAARADQMLVSSNQCHVRVDPHVAVAGRHLQFRNADEWWSVRAGDCNCRSCRAVSPSFTVRPLTMPSSSRPPRMHVQMAEAQALARRIGDQEERVVPGLALDHALACRDHRHRDSLNSRASAGQARK